jgi:hypothetical protein
MVSLPEPAVQSPLELSLLPLALAIASRSVHRAFPCVVLSASVLTVMVAAPAWPMGAAAKASSAATDASSWVAFRAMLADEITQNSFWDGAPGPRGSVATTAGEGPCSLSGNGDVGAVAPARTN